MDSFTSLFQKHVFFSNLGFTKLLFRSPAGIHNLLECHLEPTIRREYQQALNGYRKQICDRLKALALNMREGPEPVFQM